MKQFIYVMCFLLVVSCGEKKQESVETTLEKAKRIHEGVITIDTHNDINVKNFTDSVNYTQRLETQVNLPKMNEGGLDVTWLIVYTGQDTLTDEGYTKAKQNALDKFEAIRKLCEEIAPDKIELALTSADVKRIHKAGKKAAMIGVENAYPIGTDMTQFKTYFDLGARYISLAHNGHSQFSDSNTGEADNKWLHKGLSDIGKEAVIEMNRLGIMIDISHPSKEAMKQMIELSKAPIIASHSSARALCDHSRNLDDEQLMMMKENGGVVQTVAFSSYLNTEKHEARAAYMKSIYQQVADSLGITWYERSQLSSLTDSEKESFMTNYPKVLKMGQELVANKKDAPAAVNVSDFVNHIDYMVKLIGIDHVGISSDFDGGGGIEGWNDASETFNVTLELVERGYTHEEIAKLWGGNLLRVLDEVQAVAKQMGEN
ncbi:dipeptidase [Maribacter hydrothermalis]|uniref:Peptidase M19 n=1 Tax=Maribacter hydrothermalis TaxID=1836467 RepID=A0A1B7Z914_9FLAO|nr:dipeptidase [Maribacter hydrothermalis]APQ18937.1 peptidase M19 [Maribacter hydrothermalis]OBR39050.1 peptidase M19 [Maribacter hydrothermalis]